MKLGHTHTFTSILMRSGRDHLTPEMEAAVDRWLRSRRQAAVASGPGVCAEESRQGAVGSALGGEGAHSHRHAGFKMSSPKPAQHMCARRTVALGAPVCPFYSRGTCFSFLQTPFHKNQPTGHQFFLFTHGPGLS